jgi:hypothetical protein
MKELKMISSVEEGTMSYSDACNALKGESYFGLCTMESENIKNLKIYPNPSFDGKFRVEFDVLNKCSVSFSLYNVDGDIINKMDSMNFISKSLDFGLTFDFNEVAGNGVYLFSIVSDKGDMNNNKDNN